MNVSPVTIQMPLQEKGAARILSRQAGLSRSPYPSRGGTKFGNAAFAVSPLTRLFHLFESKYEPGFTLLSKILANIIPRVAITRNWTERQEVLFNELTQGATMFVSLPLLSPVADWIQSKLSGVSRELIRMRNEEALGKAATLGGEALQNKLKTAKLGKSLGVSAFIASLLIATTYWRNYRTIKKTGFSDYKKVVGLGGNNPPTAEERAQAEVAARKNLNIIKGLIAGGAAAGLAIIGGAALIARRGQAIFKVGGLLNPDRMAKLMKHWSFVGKNSNQVNMLFNSQWQTLVVWGIPSYLGWFLGCRDKFEVVEQTSKFLTFLGGYFVMPKLVQKIMVKVGKDVLAEATTKKVGPLTYTNIIDNVSKDSKELAGKLIEHKNRQWSLLSGLNLLVAGALPLVFNIFFSNWRHRRDEQALLESGGNQALPMPSTKYPHPGLRRKSFERWGNRAFAG